MPPKNPTKSQTTLLFDENTFYKAMKVQQKYNSKGTDVSKKWVEQRIYNEATVLQFIKQNTSIPVPAVLKTGEDENGFFLKTERIRDAVPLKEIGDVCSSPWELGHQVRKCTACQDIAQENARVFIEQVVLPELSRFRSSQTGWDGFVIPPPWVTEEDKRGYWEPKTSATGEEFVLCHGDLGPQNLLCDPKTLEAKAVIDWENGGYYPDVFQVYGVNMNEYFNHYRDSELPAHIRLLVD